VFRKVPVPGAVAAVQTANANTTTYAAQHALLTTEGRLFQITGTRGVYDGGTARPTVIELRTEEFRGGTPKTLLQTDLLAP